MNVIERAIRPIALGRKNTLFAGSDGGARHWAIASLVATAKLDVRDAAPGGSPTCLSGWSWAAPRPRAERLLPWSWKAERLEAAVAA